eukprot:SAG11_NODE_1148_length_5683_cov_73.890561_4_plen_304_part_00
MLQSTLPPAPSPRCSADAYLPNLPDIQKDLATSAGLASLTIQINWIVLGLVNPVIGGLSDSYGRKAITIVALIIFVVGSVGSAVSRTLSQLMLARVVMGVGQAVSVIASAVIRDLVDDTGERMRITGFFNMLQPLMILAAPSLGGVIGQLVGWRYLFWGLAAWGVITMLLVGHTATTARHPPRLALAWHCPAQIYRDSLASTQHDPSTAAVCTQVACFVPESNKAFLKRIRAERQAEQAQAALAVGLRGPGGVGTANANVINVPTESRGLVQSALPHTLTAAPHRGRGPHTNGDQCPMRSVLT